MNKDKEERKKIVVRNLSSKERSGLCPDSWEVSSKHLEFPECLSVFVIHGELLRYHMIICANVMILDGPFGPCNASSVSEEGRLEIEFNRMGMIQSIIPMQWSLNKSSGHRSSGELPCLAGILCTCCYSYGQEEVMPSMAPQGSPDNQKLYTFPDLHPLCLFLWMLLICILNLNDCQ